MILKGRLPLRTRDRADRDGRTVAAAALAAREEWVPGQDAPTRRMSVPLTGGSDSGLLPYPAWALWEWLWRAVALLATRLAAWRPIGARWPIAQDGLVALILGALLCAPMMIHRLSDAHRVFFNDWVNHLYLVARQATYLEANHFAPTYFLNTGPIGWFYPFYAFYGGTLYYLTALGAWVVGSPWAAYVDSYLFSVLAAFIGWTWLARQARVPRRLAYLPGAVFVSGAYYLTNAYGRGAWPEFVATSTLPLILAAAWSLVTRSRLALLDAALLIAGVMLLWGSHAVTMMFGSLFLAAAFVVLLALRRPPTAGPRRLASLLGLTALGVGLNGWFLVPLLAYRDTVRIQPAQLQYEEFDHLKVIFSLVPNNPWAQSTPQLYIQAPDVPLVVAGLAALAGVVLVRGWRQRLLAASILGGFALVLLLLVGPDSLWRHLPPEALYVQFRYRLNTYLLACAAGLMLVACRYAWQIRALHKRTGILTAGLLIGATLIQTGLGIHQAWTAQVVGTAEDALGRLDGLPSTWYDFNFLSGVLPSADPSTTEIVYPDPATLNDAATVITVPAHLTGGLVRVRVVPSPLIAFDPPYLVGQVNGAWNEGDAVLSVPASSTDVQVTVRSVTTWATLAGTLMTAVCLLGTLASLGFLWKRRQGARNALVTR